jgi:chromosome segregation ATPase
MGSIYLLEAEEYLKKLRGYLSEIYRFLDQAIDNAESYLRALEDVQKVLEHLLQYCKPEPLQESQRTITELRKKLNDNRLALHPHLLREMNQDLRRCEKRLQVGIKQQGFLRNQVEGIQMCLTEIRQQANIAYESLSARLKPLDDTATVMQRRLSHLEEALKAQMSSPRITAQAVGDIIVLSLQLASLIFPARLEEQLTESNRAFLNKSMAEWIRNLADYINQVADYTSKIQKGKWGCDQELQKSLEYFRKICEKVSYLIPNARKPTEHSGQDEEKSRPWR